MKKLERLTIGEKVLVKKSYGIRNLILMVFVCLAIFSLSDKLSASTLAEEFSTSGLFTNGTIVSIKKDNPEDIELSTVTNSEYLLGVITNSGDNLVAYAKDNSDVTVALTGEVQVFVNDANGEIKRGDFVGASWLEGVGMKANTNDKQKLLGIALEDFSSGSGTEYGTIETPNGGKEIRIGTIKVRLFEKVGSEQTTDKGGIENLLSKLAGKTVSPIKIIVGLIIFVMSVLISAFFVSSSIHGSFISIGRNPMASASIYRSLLHVTMVSVLIIIVGTALTYVVLVI